MPPAGFDLQAYKERVMGLPVRNPDALMCPLPGKQGEPGVGEGEPSFLSGKHERARPAKLAAEVSTKAAGDLSSYYGQQIPFNQIVALGALSKSGGVYVQANGYNEGWDDCSDTPV